MDIKKREGATNGRTSMLKDASVTLKDFLPKEGGHLMRLSSGTVVISTRLRDELRDYAARRGISLMQALERLRDEVHAAD